MSWSLKVTLRNEEPLTNQDQRRSFTHNQAFLTHAFSFTFFHLNEPRCGVWLAEIRESRHRFTGESNLCWHLSIHSLNLNPCVSFISSFPAAPPAHATVLLLQASASSYVVIQRDFRFLLGLRRSCHCGFHAPIHTFEREMFVENADLRITVVPTSLCSTCEVVKLYEERMASD